MARENQFYQITVIILVLLTILLSVTTFVSFRQYQWWKQKAVANETETVKAMNAARDALDEINDLKKWIGVPETDTLETIEEQFNTDMKKFAGNFPEDARFYRQTLERMFIVINEKNQSLDGELATVQKMKDQNEKREEVTAPRIEAFQKEAQEAGKDKQNELARFEADRERMKGDQSKIAADLQKVRKDNDVALTSLQAKLDKTQNDLKTKTRVADKALGTLDEMLRQDPETFDGQVSWVNQNSKTVWINLGRADALLPRVTFSVYSPETLDMSETGHKASIEVTQILGNHLAEARITDDRPSNPILAGDMIYTPVWTPGQKRRFTLAGLIDMDNDGKSDLEKIYALIEMNGGAIDARKDSDGKRDGMMSLTTRYLVLGKEPDATSSDEQRKDFTEMAKQAAALKIETITLERFLDRMGWKRHSQMKHFGGGHADDFPPRPGDRRPRVSGGKISDLFKSRKPPRSSGGSTF